MIDNKQVIAIIFAGGSGKRLNQSANIQNLDKLPKQFLHVNGIPIIIHTLGIFQFNDSVDKIYVAIHPNYVDYIQDLVKEYRITKVAGIVKGADTALGSQLNALELAEKENPANSIVLIHDGVRPNISQTTLQNCIDCVVKNGNAITCTNCFETGIISKDGSKIDNVPVRKETYLAQAPQGFLLGELIKVHREILKTKPTYEDLVDSCSMYNFLGKNIFISKGNIGNIKITTIEDLYLLRAYLRYNEDKNIAQSGEEILRKYENKGE